MSAAAHVITVSATTAALLTNEYGIEKPRIKVVPPGTDQAPFAYGSTDGVVSLLSVGLAPLCLIGVRLLQRLRAGVV